MTPDGAEILGRGFPAIGGLVSQRAGFATPREALRIAPSSIAKACLEAAHEIWFFARDIDPHDVAKVSLKTGRRSSIAHSRWP
jgi:hypothetical protein